MNKKNRWKVSSLLSGALALLGFAGCSNNSESLLYGTPSVDYRVVGTVTDEQGNPLKDIQVVVENPQAWEYFDDEGKPIKNQYETGELAPDTLYTDKDGNLNHIGRKHSATVRWSWDLRTSTAKPTEVNSKQNDSPVTNSIPSD